MANIQVFDQTKRRHNILLNKIHDLCHFFNSLISINLHNHLIINYLK